MIEQKPSLFTLVPGQAPIELVAYYPSFSAYYPECELQTKRWLVGHAKPDWQFLDVGANIGYYSALMSRLAPQGHIHAFEPTTTIELFKRNIAHLNCANVTPHRIAVGTTTGKRGDSIFRIWGEPPEIQLYDFSTIDDIAKRLQLARLDCIKIDVDGFDLEALKGAQLTLQRFNPWLVVELNNDALSVRQQSTAQALAWLSSQGYDEALVLDDDNYILRRDVTGTRRPNRTASIRLRFDEEPIVFPSALSKNLVISGFFAPLPDAAKGTVAATPDGKSAFQIEAPGPRWTYAALLPRNRTTAESGAGPAIVEVSLEVKGGEIGLGCVKDVSDFIGREIYVAPLDGMQTIDIEVEDVSMVEALVFRNADVAGATAQIFVHGITAYAAAPGLAPPSPLLGMSRQTIDLAECRALPLNFRSEPTSKEALPIDIVSVGELGEVLGFDRPYVSPVRVVRTSLPYFQTERDETSIYSYLYANARPKRHLEFGTWQGHGVVVCAANCDAEIWTINLPGGETDADGKAIYADPSQSNASDSGSSIGWRYKQAGYENRVHQILCDSRHFDVTPFGDGFFDTILIDGGHTRDVVISDTDKAIPLLRRGGIMIWHDFCPDLETVRLMESPRGVIEAIVDNYALWRPHFSKLFWIRPSWMLVGIKS